MHASLKSAPQLHNRSASFPGPSRAWERGLVKHVRANQHIPMQKAIRLCRTSTGVKKAMEELERRVRDRINEAKSRARPGEQCLCMLHGLTHHAHLHNATLHLVATCLFCAYTTSLRRVERRVRMDKTWPCQKFLALQGAR